MTTEVIVTDKNNTVVLDKSQAQIVREVVQSNVIVAGMIGPSGPIAINAMLDVDISNLQNGSLLIFSNVTNKWTAGNLLEQQIVESGQY
jgi:hypothetical protein